MEGIFLDRLGAGSYGDVMHFRSTIGDDYAVKSEAFINDFVSPSFLNEVAAADIEHPHIIKPLLITLDTNKSKIYFPLGGDEYYKNSHSLKDKEIFYQLIHAIATLTSQGRIHGDIKKI